ncbi:twin-arginine translocase TatA/TatE family subunit [Pseudomonas sp. WS 5027]|uniref:twin-arginine translocase TatA/TatE family subunit n=1 Tax=unclassified Pseudomonas TaxID=196821 RepID=UPI001475110C|nr:twin-arginine translocase TatA/TatE family subunit [Pseudomonas sp. WS 5086]NMY45535.1 twin-arginine translocase TatA/TatE family subunit [Pseudomonas sp. WS 5027]
MGGIGIWQLVIVLLIVVMLFGTRRLKGLGSDVGEAIKGFRSSMGNETGAQTAEKTSLEVQAEPQRSADSKH